jgi:hypothetical protein
LSSKKNSKLSPQARPHCRRREPYPHFTYDQNQAVLKDKSSPSQRPVARIADILLERSNRHSRCDGSADITRRSDGVDKREAVQPQLDVRRHNDGSIDFDFYRRRAVRRRNVARRLIVRHCLISVGKVLTVDISAVEALIAAVLRAREDKRRLPLRGQRRRHAQVQFVRVPNQGE